MTQLAPKKTPVKKTTKKRLLNKLPANLALYNYEAFSYKDMQRAVTYYQAELSKIEKLLSKLPTITQEIKVSQGNPPVGNLYMDIYGQSPIVTSNQVKQTQKPPEVVAPPLPYQPYQPGMQGDHMEMPSILGSSGMVVNTLGNTQGGNSTPFNGIQSPQAETIKLPIVEDNSAQLGAELGALLNEN
jgi:hypothetical protein